MSSMSRLPEVGKTLEKGAEAAVVESVKAASEVFAPVAGEVVEVNERTRRTNQAPSMQSAEENGWFCQDSRSPMQADELNTLMDGNAYKAFHRYDLSAMADHLYKADGAYGDAMTAISPRAAIRSAHRLAVRRRYRS